MAEVRNRVGHLKSLSKESERSKRAHDPRRAATRLARGESRRNTGGARAGNLIQSMWTNDASRVRGRERKAGIQATERRCKRLLHWVANLAILGVRDTNKAVSETRFGGFSFCHFSSSSWTTFGIIAGSRNHPALPRVCPILESAASRIQLTRVITKLYNFCECWLRYAACAISGSCFVATAAVAGARNGVPDAIGREAPSDATSARRVRTGDPARRSRASGRR